MGLFGKRQEPSEEYALTEQVRGDGMVQYALDHPEKDTRLWGECAQEAFRSAATHTAQPKRGWWR